MTRLNTRSQSGNLHLSQSCTSIGILGLTLSLVLGLLVKLLLSLASIESLLDVLDGGVVGLVILELEAKLSQNSLPSSALFVGHHGIDLSLSITLALFLLLLVVLLLIGALLGTLLLGVFTLLLLIGVFGIHCDTLLHCNPCSSHMVAILQLLFTLGSLVKRAIIFIRKLLAPESKFALQVMILLVELDRDLFCFADEKHAPLIHGC